MDPTRYAVTDVVIETPRYGGAEGVGGWEHDIIGHGWAEINGDAIVIAIHPRGVMAKLEPKEKRTYSLADITSWEAKGTSIGFGVGNLGVFATNGAESPNHICQMQCVDADAARKLTEEARAGGMQRGKPPRPYHSGI
jgi:hypothetical protein